MYWYISNREKKKCYWKMSGKMMKTGANRSKEDEQEENVRKNIFKVCGRWKGMRHVERTGVSGNTARSKKGNGLPRGLTL
jgi:hypothetical protein